MLDTLITGGCYPDFGRDRMIEANIGIENGKEVLSTNHCQLTLTLAIRN